MKSQRYSGLYPGDNSSNYLTLEKAKIQRGSEEGEQQRMDFPELTTEERWIWTNRVFNKMVLKIMKAVEEKYGQEGKEVVRKALYEVGREVGLQLRDLLKVSGKEPADYAKLHYYQDTNLWAIKEEVSQDKSGTVTIRATYCPAQGIFSPKDCGMFVPYVQGLMDVINPKLKWTTTKVLTRGDDCCEFIVSKE